MKERVSSKPKNEQEREMKWKSQREKVKLPSVKIVYSVLMKITESYLILLRPTSAVSEAEGIKEKAYGEVEENFNDIKAQLPQSHISIVQRAFLFIGSGNNTTGKLCIYREWCWMFLGRRWWWWNVIMFCKNPTNNMLYIGSNTIGLTTLDICLKACFVVCFSSTHNVFLDLAAE